MGRPKKDDSVKLEIKTRGKSPREVVEEIIQSLVDLGKHDHGRVVVGRYQAFVAKRVSDKQRGVALLLIDHDLTYFLHDADEAYWRALDACFRTVCSKREDPS